MEDLSSSSYNTEKEDLVIPDQDKSITVQDLTYKNERLQEMNSQLQSSLETVKNQLKEALTYKNSISSMGQQIQSLQEKVTETTEQNKKLTKQLQLLSNQKEENEKALKEEITKAKNQYNEAVSSNQKLNDKNLRLRKERDDIVAELGKKQELAEAVGIELQKLMKKKKRICDKLSAANTANQQLKVSITDNERRIQNISAENKLLKQEIDDLKLQVGTQQAIQGGNSNAIGRLNDDLKVKMESISVLEDTIKSQLSEIEQLTEQRDTLVQLLQKSHCVLCKTETTTFSMKSELDSLKARQQQVQSKNFKMFPEPSFSLSGLNIPFEGALGNETQKIVKYEHYQPQQRIQLILNESQKRIAQLESTVSELQEEKAKFETISTESEKKAEMNLEFLNAIIKELKNLASNETQLSRTSGIKEDRSFISFVAQKCSEVDPLIKEIAASNSKYIPSYFFFADDQEQRIATLQRLLSPNEETMSLFMTQFLLNIQLRRQLNKATIAAEQAHEFQPIIESLGVQKADEIPLLIDDYKEQIEKLSTARTQLRKSLKQSQAALLQQNKADNTCQVALEKLQLQVDTLSNEREILEVKVNVMENDIRAKDTEIKSLNKQLTDALARCNGEKETELEMDIQNKQNQIKSLNEQISQLQNQLEGAAAIQQRALKKQENAHRKMLEELSLQLTQVAEENERKFQKSKKIIKALKTNHQLEMEKCKSNYEASKAMLEQSNAQLANKAKEATENTQKLIQNLADSEKEIQKLSSENAKLCATQKALEVQLAAAKDKAVKEKQNSQNQIAAQALVIESKIQERANQIKQEFNEQKKNLVDSVLRTIGQVYSINHNVFDEQNLDQLLIQAQKDLEKLKMFQSSTPTCCLTDH